MFTSRNNIKKILDRTEIDKLLGFSFSIQITTNRNIIIMSDDDYLDERIDFKCTIKEIPQKPNSDNLSQSLVCKITPAFITDYKYGRLRVKQIIIDNKNKHTSDIFAFLLQLKNQKSKNKMFVYDFYGNKIEPQRLFDIVGYYCLDDAKRLNYNDLKDIFTNNFKGDYSSLQAFIDNRTDFIEYRPVEHKKYPDYEEYNYGYVLGLNSKKRFI